MKKPHVGDSRAHTEPRGMIKSQIGQVDLLPPALKIPKHTFMSSTYLLEIGLLIFYGKVLAVKQLCHIQIPNKEELIDSSKLKSLMVHKALKANHEMLARG